jgi:hypothetical protein
MSKFLVGKFYKKKISDIDIECRHYIKIESWIGKDNDAFGIEIRISPGGLFRIVETGVYVFEE